MAHQTRSDRIRNFQEGLNSVRDQLYYYALQLTENRDDAQDLVQETSYKALKNYSGLRELEYKNAWLYTILRNTYINNLRSGHNRNIQANRSEEEILVTTAMLPEDEVPDKLYERKELMASIRSLAPVYARPLKLFISGYSYKEIAKMTGVPIGTIKSRIHFAKQKLKIMYRVN